MSYSGPIVIGVDGHAVQQDVVGQLSVEQLFNVQVEDARDDKLADDATIMMHKSDAQHARSDKGTIDTTIAVDVPTLADVPTGRQSLARVRDGLRSTMNEAGEVSGMYRSAKPRCTSCAR